MQLFKVIEDEAIHKIISILDSQYQILGKKQSKILF